MSNICRICKSSGKIVIDLNKQPLANQILKSKKNKQRKYPLKVFRCNKCSTLQLTNNINPKLMFSNYVWVTGTSKSTIDYLKKFTKNLKKKFDQNSKVLEIASNDGSFLKILKSEFKHVYGVEPAQNLSKIANRLKCKTFNYFFNEQTAKIIKNKIKSKVDVIIARNVIPHINNLDTVFKGVDYVLNKNGKFIIEFHYSKSIFDKMQFDYIYHEHTYYFSIKTISSLAKKYGFHLNDIKKSKISGDSLIVTFSKIKGLSKEAKNLIKIENQSKINTLKCVENYNAKLIEYSKKFKSIIRKYNNQNIVGFGSSARSNTLINYLSINDDEIKFIFDNNPLKHNKFAPGSKIKIIKPTRNKIDEVDLVIVFAWNFYKEIKKNLNLLKYKGKIIKTLPALKIETI